MKCILETYTNEKGRIMFTTEKSKNSGCLYTVIDEKGAITKKDKKWVLDNLNSITNVGLSGSSIYYRGSSTNKSAGKFEMLDNDKPWGVSKDRQIALSELYHNIKIILKRKYRLNVTGGELFNSGYHGLKFLVNGIQFLVLDQPGVMGSDDQQEGYIELIKSFNKDKRIDKQAIKLIKHKEHGFGDINITDEERKLAYDKIYDLIPKML